MTTTAQEPSAAPAGPAAKAGFGRVLASEWTKIRTVRSTFWTLLAGVVVSVGLSVLISLAFVSSYDQLPEQDKATFDTASFSLVGLNFGMVAFGVLGVLVVTGEYATGMIRTSLIAVPRRTQYLAAKALVLAALVLVVGLVVSFASFFLAQLVYATKNLDGSLGDPGVLRAVIGGAVYLTLIALISLAVGMLLRHTAGAVTTVLGALFVLPIIGSFLPGDWGDTVAKLLPSNAGGMLMTARDMPDALSPVAGGAVFALYTAIVLAAAFVSFQRRDA
ncbi:ABC-2 family transporter protein [Thermomonospora echinospora]|uniref:ABC-2 family transporter protein n=1 Tax=Thermomonospora echinospora TaxID=1992 RepID=A0A1H5SIN3_9ACTN|nr:ABC transporter permease subunit [Thermomonospora echinospora]SEF50264.1 ABC-2 family transporter protein [Thermomonospora echinospora]